MIFDRKVKEAGEKEPGAQQLECPKLDDTFLGEFSKS